MSLINYIKTVWTNGQAPAINATNLNKMEQGIKDACDSADSCGYESGSESGWTWKKYADGTFDAWVTHTYPTVACTQSSEAYGGYKTANELTVQMPADIQGWTFTNIIASKQNANSLRLVNCRKDGNALCNFFASGSSQTLNNQVVSYYIHGTWE